MSIAAKTENLHLMSVSSVNSIYQTAQHMSTFPSTRSIKNSIFSVKYNNRSYVQATTRFLVVLKIAYFKQNITNHVFLGLQIMYLSFF
jgi:hypothetical protein